MAAKQDTSLSAILKLSGGEGEETFIDIFNVREKFICVLILGAVHKLRRGGGWSLRILTEFLMRRIAFGSVASRFGMSCYLS